MPIYESPYYGTRRKALTGETYGPYYGMTFPGGGALPPEGRRALPTEISEKYEATGTPAISAEGIDQPEFSDLAFADDPQATWGSAFYAAGLPGGKAYPGTAQPKGLTKTALGIAPTVASIITGVPGIAWTQVVRNFLNPLLSKAFPNLFTVGSQPSEQATSFAPAFSEEQFSMMDFGMSAPGDGGGVEGGWGGGEAPGEAGTGLGGSATGGAPW